jgi:protein-L-isoaspartate(D-aspartate) O-methyltransferase
MINFSQDYDRVNQELMLDLKKEFELTALATGIASPSIEVITAMSVIKRHLFINKNHQHLAYKNIPIPIKSNQTISQPFIVALMTELLDLQPLDRVLEIGTGSGYQTAILSMLALQVYTIEIFANLFNDAVKKFQQLNLHNIYPLEGDGNNGWPEHAPYNKIIITAGAKRISDSLISQLCPNGIMVAPIGDVSKQQTLYKITKTVNNLVVKKPIIPVVFVPFINS